MDLLPLIVQRWIFFVSVTRTALLNVRKGTHTQKKKGKRETCLCSSPHPQLHCTPFTDVCVSPSGLSHLKFKPIVSCFLATLFCCSRRLHECIFIRVFLKASAQLIMLVSPPVNSVHCLFLRKEYVSGYV